MWSDTSAKLAVSLRLVAAEQKPGAASEGTIAHVPLNTAEPSPTTKVACDLPPITGSFVSSQSNVVPGAPSNVAR